MRAATASLNPDDFRHQAAAAQPGQIQISQVDHGYQVRAIAEMHIPCACGRPLCGVDTEWIADPKGYALHFSGVCLTCGVQSGIYVSEPRLATEAAETARKAAKLASDVTAILERVAQLRKDAGELEQATDAALDAVQEVA